MKKDFSQIATVTIEFKNLKGEPFYCDVRRLNRINFSFFDKSTCILVCPGFMAYKDWGPYQYYGNKFAEAGFVSVVMNYSHSGIKEDVSKITDYDNFASNTVTQELIDMNIVIESIAEGMFSEYGVDENKIIILGHSRGAANAIITAARDKRIKALVTWAAIADYDRWTEHQKKEWKKSGYLPRKKDFEANPLRMDVSFLDDIEINKDKFNLIAAAQKVKVPWLIVHAEEDLLAKITEAEQLHNASNKSTTEFIRLKKLGHLLGVEIPFDDSNPAINNVLDLTINWMHKNI
jgi:dienelactone hydrolase